VKKDNGSKRGNGNNANIDSIVMLKCLFSHRNRMEKLPVLIKNKGIVHILSFKKDLF